MEDPKEGFSQHVTLEVRVIESELKKFTVTMRRHANDRVMDVAKEIGNLINEPRYGLSFYFAGQTVHLPSRLGDNQIGVP